MVEFFDKLTKLQGRCWIVIVIVTVIFLGHFGPRGKVPTLKEQHKGQPQQRETSRPTLSEQCVGSLRPIYTLRFVVPICRPREIVKQIGTCKWRPDARATCRPIWKHRLAKSRQYTRPTCFCPAVIHLSMRIS